MTHYSFLTPRPGPCDPVNVTSNLHCGSDMATVSWVAAAGAVAYTVFARDSSAQNNISCRSNSTSCQLNQLQCGKAYNLTVVAEDDTCNSTGSTGAVLMTGRRQDRWTDWSVIDQCLKKHLEHQPYTELTLHPLCFPLSSLLSLHPEQHPDLWNQFFLSIMGVNGWCDRLHS